MNFKKSLTIFVVAVLISSIASITFATTSAFAQTPGVNTANNNQNFKEFLTCLLDDNANETVSQAEITAALGTTNVAPTEEEIRECFAPIYNPGGSTPNTDNNDDNDGDEDNTDNGNEEEENN